MATATASPNLWQALGVFGSIEEKMLYFMAMGYADDAAAIAKELASNALYYRMGRRLCPYTGQYYFYEWSDEGDD